MRCPLCQHLQSRVVDSRASEDGREIRRRRECEATGCQTRFTTYERIEGLPIGPTVVKKDGRREPYDRAKLVAGLRRACEKRPVSPERIESVADAIESAMRQQMDRDGEVSSRLLGESAMKELALIDEVAYVRFASVYRTFKDVTEYEAVLRELSALKSRGDHPARKRGRKPGVVARPGALPLGDAVPTPPSSDPAS